MGKDRVARNRGLPLGKAGGLQELRAHYGRKVPPVSSRQEAGAWASLVAQWLRIRLPMQATRVRALVREVPTCRGATKPAHHNY